MNRFFQDSTKSPVAPSKQEQVNRYLAHNNQAHVYHADETHQDKYNVPVAPQPVGQ